MIHVPSLYVDRVFVGDPECEYTENMIERLTIQDYIEVKRKVRNTALKKGDIKFAPNDPNVKPDVKEQIRYKIARRAGKEVIHGMNVNLGIGIPTILP